VELLLGGEHSPNEATAVGEALHETEVRYVAVLRTLDRSVPVTPIRNVLRSVILSLKRADRNLADDLRDKIVYEAIGLSSASDIPDDFQSFEEAEILAEKAAIARKMIISFGDEISKVAEHFNYKSNLVRPGRPPIYSRVYLVHALAEIFETHEPNGRKAVISRNTRRPRGRVNDEDPFAGNFLPFIEHFLTSVNPPYMSEFWDGKLREQLRKLAEKRNRSPDVHKILAGDPDVRMVLKFMKQADELK